MGSRSYGCWLWLLLGLFCVRVLAQLVQRFGDVPFLPPFEAWHSSVVPYSVLLATQVAIVGLGARVAAMFHGEGIEPSQRSAWLWLSFGGVYALAMATRLVLGLTVLSSHYWFANHLPTFFHLVLASFLLVAGSFHARHAGAARV